jgi:hypothetical protein
MATDPNSPLTADHLEQINNALSVIAVAENQVAMAKRAGINVDAQEAQLSDSKDKLLRVKNVYFPGQ